MRVGLEILARRVAWALTPTARRGTIELWHNAFVDTAGLPPPGELVRVLDVGAYFGDFALAAADALRRRRNRVSLVLVEPVFTHAATVIARELSRGPVYATVVAAAVADDGRFADAVPLYVPAAHRGLGATLYRDHGDVTPTTRTVLAPATPLGVLLDDDGAYGPFDLVKLNIEGAELGALGSLPDWQVERVRQWHVEFHTHAGLGGPAVAAAVARFERLGFAAVQTHRYGPVYRFVR